MTQEQLAQRLGIGKAALSMIETGKCGLSTRNKNILVQDLNVNPDWLDTGKGNMFNAEQRLKQTHQLYSYPQPAKVRRCDLCFGRLDVSVAQKWRYCPLQAVAQH